MEHQSISHDTTTNRPIEDPDAEYHDALDQFTFDESISSSNPHTNDDNCTLTLNRSSAVTTINTVDEQVNDESVTVDSPNSPPNHLIIIIITQLVIDAISFQTNLLLNFVKFSVRVIYSSYMLLNNPYNIIKLASSGICYNNESALKFCVRIGWGLLWLAYCVVILLSLLVSALVISGVIVRRVVEEPVQMTEQLSWVCWRIRERVGLGGLLERESYLKATVSLVLPESDYNRKLGIFQVRIDFLSSDNKLLTISRKPCMLQFKSDPIRLLSTFFKLPSLLTGYPSETQTLDININGYTEKDTPLSCLRVAIEQRAEFAKGAGVPEIYSAFIKLESRFSFLKRMLWCWKWLIYMWISSMMFMIELLFTVLCCTPVMFPWVRRVGGYSANTASHSRSKPPG